MTTETDGRPLVSFVLLAYNHGKFVAESIRAAFAQTYSPLEIIIIDDCSPDDTASVITEEIEAYSGDKSVTFIRNEINLGLARSINRAMAEAKSDFIIPIAGDDVSEPSRTSRVMSMYLNCDDVTYVHSNAWVIDEQGVRNRLLYPLGFDRRRHDLTQAARDEFAIFGCTQTWRRKIFDVFGPMPDDVVMEDLVIPFRAALLGRLCYIEEPLVLYREHRTNAYLGVVKDDQTVAEWYGIIAKRLEQQKGGLAANLLDLAIAEKIYPERAAEYSLVRKHIKARVAEADVVQKGLTDAKVGARMRAAFAVAALTDRPRRERLRWLATLLAPKAYRFRSRRIAAKIAAKGAC